jgi:hypothetical protein
MMRSSKTSRLAPLARRPAATTTAAMVDGLFADPCWPDSTGNTRCVLCGKAVGNTYVARSSHARVHVGAGEVWEHRDVLGRTVWFPRE